MSLAADQVSTSGNTTAVQAGNATLLNSLNGTSASLESHLALNEWGDLLVGPYNQSESEAWQREYLRQYEMRYRNDPEVKYAVLIFYLIMVSSKASRLEDASSDVL